MHLGAGLDGLLLRAHVHAADDGDAGEAEVVAEREGLLVDLQRELARGRQHEHRELARRRADELLQDGQQERRRLAGARRRRPDEVAPGDGERDGLLLDGGGLGVAHVADRREEGGREAEVVEGGDGGSSGAHLTAPRCRIP
jgi:hypothetical protein